MELQILDVDYITVDEKPIVRIFGKTEDGKTACCFYEGYMPYFYANGGDVRKVLEGDNQAVEIKEVERTLVGGYQNPRKLWKITLRNPARTPELREKLKARGITAYEADILFKYRFMNDMGLNGLDWIKVDFNGTNTNTVKVNQCVRIKNFKRISKDMDAQLKYISLDIECVPIRKGSLPESERDPVVLISLIFSEPFKGRKSMVLSTRTGDGVESFESEKEMLEGFMKVLEEYDPDIITGYNINNFDFPYILERMKRNKIKPALGRCKQKSVIARKVMSRHKIQIVGRMMVDSFEIVKKDFSLMRYGLDFVAQKLLNKKKEDVKLSDIEKLWRGSQEEFRRLVSYCKKDAELAMELLLRLNLIDKYIALSKVSGTLLQDTLDSGETTRIENFILREFNKQGYVLPCRPDGGQVAKREKNRRVGLKGGFVLEPEKKLHSNIIVLDFLAMYPSIIRTYNICPTTILKDIPFDKPIKTPLGTMFAPKETRHGIIPSILEKLMKERQGIKRKLKSAGDVEKKRVLDAKQWALKIMSNAFYGHMGYSRARIYDLDIANTITYCGRNIIQNTKSTIEKELGYKVVYGDTDSVFVDVDLEDMEKLRAAGDKISKHVTGKLPGIMELEFEKVFKRFLPLTKKRYIAWKFESSGEGWKDSMEMKGIETVRRDWCPLVSETINNVIDIILKQDNSKAALHYFKETVGKLLKGDIPIQRLVITKTMTKQPKTYAGMQPHIELVKKIQLRSPAEAPGIGDRIGYVIVKGTGLLSKRAEDPVFVMEKGLETDSHYYIENQLLPPLERIFGALGVSKPELLGNGKQIDLLCALNNNKKEKQLYLSDVNGFVCKSCSRFYSRIPLKGSCECGGDMLFSSPMGTAACVNIS